MRRRIEFLAAIVRSVWTAVLAAVNAQGLVSVALKIALVLFLGGGVVVGISAGLSSLYHQPWFLMVGFALIVVVAAQEGAFRAWNAKAVEVEAVGRECAEAKKALATALAPRIAIEVEAELRQIPGAMSIAPTWLLTVRNTSLSVARACTVQLDGFYSLGVEGQRVHGTAHHLPWLGRGRDEVPVMEVDIAAGDHRQVQLMMKDSGTLFFVRDGRPLPMPLYDGKAYAWELTICGEPIRIEVRTDANNNPVFSWFHGKDNSGRAA